MSKAKILILGGLRKDQLTDLEKECDVTVGPAVHRLHDDCEWVLDHIADYDGVIVAKMAFDKEMIDAAKNLKIISTYGVGFDHVDVEYAKEKGFVVSNCPKSVLRPTAELTLTMIMASARRLRYYDHALREGVQMLTNMITKATRLKARLQLFQVWAELANKQLVLLRHWG